MLPKMQKVGANTLKSDVCSFIELSCLVVLVLQKYAKWWTSFHPELDSGDVLSDLVGLFVSPQSPFFRELEHSGVIHSWCPSPPIKFKVDSLPRPGPNSSIYLLAVMDADNLGCVEEWLPD